MIEKNKWQKWVIIFLCIYILFLLNIPKGYISKEKIIEKSDTVFVEETDTLYLTKPTLVEKEVIKTDTVFNENGDTIQLETERKIYNDTICSQNDSIILTNYIQGINPKLDSIKVDWKKQNTIITNTVVKYKNQKGLIITPQIGVGYGIFNKKADIFVGIGLSYKF